MKKNTAFCSFAAIVAFVAGLKVAKVCTEQSLAENQIRILSKEETIREITDFLALEFKSLVELGAEGKIEEYSLRTVNRWVGHLAEIVEQ